MLETTIDELSFVFLPEFQGYLNDYPDFAKRILQEIDKNINLAKYVALDDRSNRGFAGYDAVTTFDDGKVMLAYNSVTPRMGVYCKFSGQGLKHYMLRANEENEDFTVADLVKKFFKIEDYYKNSRVHVSKIDLVIDFKNEGANVQDIYDRINKGTKIYNANGRLNNCKVSAVIEDRKVNTIYCGNYRGKKTKSFLRIYDKKVEQLAKHGMFEAEAETLNDWVRWEVSYRAEYAKQVGESLYKAKNNEISSIIFRRVTDKYRFKNEDRYWPETEKMLELANTEIDVMTRIIKEKSDLYDSYKYLIKTAGLMSFMYKLKKIYGEQAIDEFLEQLKVELEVYKPNATTMAFLSKKGEEIKNQDKPWE